MAMVYGCVNGSDAEMCVVDKLRSLGVEVCGFSDPSHVLCQRLYITLRYGTAEYAAGRSINKSETRDGFGYVQRHEDKQVKHDLTVRKGDLHLILECKTMGLVGTAHERTGKYTGLVSFGVELGLWENYKSPFVVVTNGALETDMKLGRDMDTFNMQVERLSELTEEKLDNLFNAIGMTSSEISKCIDIIEEKYPPSSMDKLFGTF